MSEKTKGEAVGEFLKTLGDTPDRVALHLAAMGVRGRTCDTDRCPVANLLRREFPGLEFSVDSDLIDIRWKTTEEEDPYGEGGWDNVKPPEPVRQMIDNFDGGMYANLREGS